MAFSITPLEPAEVPDLLELIRELAHFEKLEAAVEATVPLLEESLFGPRAVAGALLARQGEELAGYAIWFFTFSSFLGQRGLWLDDLYVRPVYRRLGLGQALLQRVANVAAQNQCGRFEWTALNWNENAIRFYEKLGARKLDEWVMMRVDRAGIANLARRQSNPPTQAN